MAPAYTTTGEPVPDQRHLDLPGYPGGYDIIGNWVNKQFQLDAFGESLLLFAAAAKHDRLDTQHWAAAEKAAAAIAARWQEPDAGIWELENRAVDAQPADRGRRAARDRRRTSGLGASGRVAGAGRQDRGRHLGHVAAPGRTLAARAR